MEGAQGSNNGNNVQFNSADIGVKTAVKQDPFATQNKRTTDQKQKNAKNRKTIYLTVAIIVGLILIALIVWLAVLKATQEDGSDNGGSTGDEIGLNESVISAPAEEVQNIAQEAYDSGNTTEAEEVFENAVNAIENSGGDSSAAQSQINQINLSKMVFYTRNVSPEMVISTGENINPEQLSLREQMTYYNCLSTAYDSLNDLDRTAEYYEKARQAAIELGGIGDGDE